MLDNIQPNDSYTFAFDELSEFDKTTEFTFPESSDVNFYVSGREADQSIESASYLHHFQISNDLRTSIKGGYLNTLTRYVTSLSVSYPTYKFFYHNKGSIPETNISAPSPAGYAILSKDIQNFSATSSAAFIYTRSFFPLCRSSQFRGNGILVRT
jgi:hypothetical protein